MMTDDLAKRISADFCGHAVGGYVVNELYRLGGTSVILLGGNADDRVAIKIYAKELFEGADTNQAVAELERISRQLSVKDQPHPNIVRTRSAGKCDRTGYHYLVMDFVPDPTIEEVLHEVPREKIRCIIQQLAKATLFLHATLKHVHRDIKPSNVALRLSDFHTILLDLGLIRPIYGQTATDQGTPKFLGTKRYAAPESLNGSVPRDANGWLAVTYYQLGGVLHDLIMRRQLFEDHKGASLVQAVLTEVPHIDASDMPLDLIKLARDCLQKKPEVRLSLVSWDRFLAMPNPDIADSERDYLRQVIGQLGTKPPFAHSLPEGAREKHMVEKALQSLSLAIDYHMRALLNSDDTLYPQPIVDLSHDSPISFVLKVTMTYPRQGADLPVTLFVSCKLNDASSQLCQCNLAACEGTHSAIPANASSIELHNGSFVAGMFAASLQSELPKALAALLKAHKV